MLAIKWSSQHIEYINGVSDKKLVVKISPKIQHQLATSGTPKIKRSIWIGGTTFVDITTKKSWVANVSQIWLVLLPLWIQEQRNHGQNVFATFDAINYNSETKELDQRRQGHWCLMGWSLSFTMGYVAFIMNVCWLRIIMLHGKCKKIL